MLLVVDFLFAGRATHSYQLSIERTQRQIEEGTGKTT
jgi:hypothetical protein